MEKEVQGQKKGMSKKTLIIVAVVVAIVGVCLYFWLGGRKYETSDNAQVDGDIVSMKAGVTAYLDKIYFTDNQQVKKGDTLMRFNTTTLGAKVQKAEAALADAYAQIRVSGSRALASIENATASSKMAQSNQQGVRAAMASVTRAQEEFERTKKLLEIKAATQQQFETARTQLEVAKADYAQNVGRQQSSVATAQGQQATAQSEREQIGTAQALVEQRKAELILAQEDLEHAYVIAPRSGIVTKRSVQEGNYVSIGQSLCAVVDYEHLWITANLKETQLHKIRPGQEVEVKVDAFPNLHLKGVVASVGGATGAKFSLMPPDNASGNFVKVVQRVPIRIELVKSQENSSLYPGLSAFVKVKIR
jgi:membrane fusion protein (multidrug efflux system)